MAEPVLIDLSNYSQMLVQSAEGRTGSPDGNVFFDVENGLLELITAEELAQIRLQAAESGLIQINADSSGTFTRTSGSFVDDGFAVGQLIKTTGFASEGNNSSFTIDSITATVITVTDATGMVTETGDGFQRVRGFGDLEDNPLTNQLGVAAGGLYAFERQERRLDEHLRQFDPYLRGSFKFAGAYEMVFGRKLAGDDRNKIRASGLIERAVNGNIDRIYFGVVSLGNIEATSQPYYQLEEGGEGVDFAKAGPVDEMVQVFGSTANGDSGAGDFTNLFFLTNKVRTFGFNFDEKDLSDSGVVEMSGYSTGFALTETPHLTSGNYDLADVYGVGQTAPWTGMSLEKLVTPQTEGGFNEADGNFTWVLRNTENGSLDQCVAFLDALAITDDDIDSGAETTTRGRRVGTWYTYDAQGRIVTRSGADELGLFIENIPTSDEQRIVFTDDTGDSKTRPFNVEINFNVGSNAASDPNAWYHAHFLDGDVGQDFNTPSAVTVEDNEDNPMKGPVGGLSVVSKGFDYDGNTQAGLAAGTDKDVVVQCEGDGVATQAKTIFTITRTATINVAVAPGLETNV